MARLVERNQIDKHQNDKLYTAVKPVSVEIIKPILSDAETAVFSKAKKLPALKQPYIRLVSPLETVKAKPKLPVQPAIHLVVSPKIISSIEHINADTVVIEDDITTEDITAQIIHDDLQSADANNEQLNFEITEHIEPATDNEEIIIAAVTEQPVATIAFEIADTYSNQAVELSNFSLLLESPIIIESETLDLLHETGYELPETPPICIEVSSAVQELGAEPAEAAKLLMNEISQSILLVIEQRTVGDADAPITEELLREQCIKLFESLGIEELNDETIMEFVIGIMKAQKAIEDIALIIQNKDEGTHEIKLDEDINQGKLTKILRYPVRTLGTLILQLSDKFAA